MANLGRDPAAVKDRNLCYSDRWSQLEGAPPPGSGFIGLEFQTHNERMMPTLSWPGRETRIVVTPPVWW